MKNSIDARGLACPLPVVHTKNKIESMQTGEQLEVIVDNEIAVQNLTKFAQVRQHGIQFEKHTDTEYHVTITVGQVGEKIQEEISCQPVNKTNTVVVLASGEMGQGDPALGKTLMKAFLFALTKQDSYPNTILLYNSAAFLSCQGSDSLEDLKLLEENGVSIQTCGTCLNFYGLTEKLAVGSVTNMYDIVETMQKAGKIIKP